MEYIKAFKAYDIRGIFGEEIDNNFAFLMWYGIGDHLIQKHWSKASLLVSSDTRKINTDLIKHFLAGATNAWLSHIDTIDILANKDYPYGIISTSAAYRVGMDDRDMTAIFTASHNPAEYTGIKAFDRNAWLIDTKNLYQMFNNAQENQKSSTASEPADYRRKPEKIQEKIESYYQYLSQKWSQLQKNHKFVVDFCHGATVTIEKSFYDQYANNHLIIMINDYPDGTFPAHEWDTGNPENYKQLREYIQQEQAEFWIMFDGDGDRIGFVSNSGKVINGDIIYAIIATQLLKEHKEKNPTLLYDCMSSQTVAETIQKHWWKAQISKVGRFFINHAMVKAKALAGGEVSGHYMFQEVWYVESVLLAQYYVMKALENYNNFDDMIQEYNKYYKWPVKAYKVTDKEAIIETIREKYKEYNPQNIDGVSIYTDNYRFNVRWSNTENKIRFTVEAQDQKTREKVTNELENIIQ